MWAADLQVGALADDAVVADYDSADQRVGTDFTATPFRDAQGAAHIL